MKKIAALLTALMLFTILSPAAMAAGGSALPLPESDTGYIITLREPAADSVRLMADTGLEEISADNGVYYAETAEQVRTLGGRVEDCVPNVTVKLFAAANDRYSSQQWNLDSLGIDAAWNAGLEGAGVRVAVIDSGVLTSHEDFEKTSITTGYNAVDGSAGVSDESSEGHGTFVAGILAATRNNSKGIAGLLGGVTLVPIKCFGSENETGVAYVLKGIYAAVDDLNCDVINLSLGMTSDLLVMRQAVEYAAGKGVIIVSAVGNDGTDELNYPAAYSCVIGVGSCNDRDRVESFSQKNSSVSVVAPGSKIISTGGSARDSYYEGSGTSFSTPHVSAAAAIMKEYCPQADYQDFYALLQASCTDIETPGYDKLSGFGELNIAKMIEVMKDYYFAEPETEYTDIAGHWAESNIVYCVKNGCFTGVSDTRFAPDELTSRAMYVTVLSRLSGDDMSAYSGEFIDVPEGSWYDKPCGWGAANGIVAGVGNGLFLPKENVTREQMAVFLYRFAQYEGQANDEIVYYRLDAYHDSGSISDWAREAMAWCLEHSFITGRTNGGLCPKDTASRAEVATVIARYDCYVSGCQG